MLTSFLVYLHIYIYVYLCITSGQIEEYLQSLENLNNPSLLTANNLELQSIIQC